MAHSAPAASPARGGKRARTRERLLDAAAALIGKQGFHSTTLEQVAASVGMSRGAIYGNFKSREDLFLAVVKQRWKPIVPELEEGASFAELMRAVGQAVVAAAPARQRSAMGALSFQLYALSHPTLRARVSQLDAATYRRLAERLGRRFSAQQLPLPAERFVRVLHALVEGLLFQRFLKPDLFTDDVLRSAFEMVGALPGRVSAKGRKPRRR